MKVALVEMGHSHDECLYAQLKILHRTGISVTLICNETLQDRIQYYDIAHETIYVTIRNGWRGRKDIKQIAKQLADGAYDRVILNTAQGKYAKRLVAACSQLQCEFMGVLHNTRKLNHGISQKAISKKVTHYLVLNEYLMSQTGACKCTTPFYPIFFPKYPDIKLQKASNDIWVCIPGQVELKRRDYETLFQELNRSKLKGNIKFLLLGSCEHAYGNGRYVKQAIRDLGLTPQFMLWDDFIDAPTFYGYVKRSDYVLPLIHPDHVSFALYQHQITGAFNLAFGYKIPLIMHRCFESYEDFKANAIFYDSGELMKAINELQTPDTNDYYHEKKWTFEYQQNVYLNLLR